MKPEIRRSIESILNPNFKGKKHLLPINIGEGKEIELKRSFIQKVFFKEKDEIIIEGPIYKMSYTSSGTRSHKSYEGIGDKIGNYEIRNLKKGLEFIGEVLNTEPDKYTNTQFYFSIPKSLLNN